MAQMWSLFNRFSHSFSQSYFFIAVLHRNLIEGQAAVIEAVIVEGQC